MNVASAKRDPSGNAGHRRRSGSIASSSISAEPSPKRRVAPQRCLVPWCGNHGRPAIRISIKLLSNPPFNYTKKDMGELGYDFEAKVCAEHTDKDGNMLPPGCDPILRQTLLECQKAIENSSMGNKLLEDVDRDYLPQEGYLDRLGLDLKGFVDKFNSHVVTADQCLEIHASAATMQEFIAPSTSTKTVSAQLKGCKAALTKSQNQVQMLVADLQQSQDQVRKLTEDIEKLQLQNAKLAEEGKGKCHFEKEQFAPLINLTCFLFFNVTISSNFA